METTTKKPMPIKVCFFEASDEFNYPYLILVCPSAPKKGNQSLELKEIFYNSLTPSMLELNVEYLEFELKLPTPVWKYDPSNPVSLEIINVKEAERISRAYANLVAWLSAEKVYHEVVLSTQLNKITIYVKVRELMPHVTVVKPSGIKRAPRQANRHRDRGRLRAIKL